MLNGNAAQNRPEGGGRKEYLNAVALLAFVSMYVGSLYGSLSSLDCQSVFLGDRDLTGYYILILVLGPAFIYLAVRSSSWLVRVSFILTVLSLVASSAFIDVKASYLILGKIVTLTSVMCCLLRFLSRRE